MGHSTVAREPHQGTPVLIQMVSGQPLKYKSSIIILLKYTYLISNRFFIITSPCKEKSR